MKFLKRISKSLKSILIILSRQLQYEPATDLSLRYPWKNRFFSFKGIPKQIKSRNPYSEAFEVPIDSMTTRLGFSLAREGWHPFVQTLEEYKLNSNLIYEDSTLAKVYSSFTPNNIQDLLFSDSKYAIEKFSPIPAHYYFLTNIWILNKSLVEKKLNELRNTKDVYKGWIYYGPNSAECGNKEFERLIGVYNSIKLLGYDVKYQTNHMNGYFLKNGEEMKFVLLQGNHRVAALKSLGYKFAKVVIRNGHPILIERANLKNWVNKNDVFYNEVDAEKIFDSLYMENGTNLARRIGLIN